MGFMMDLLEPESPDLLSWIFTKFPRNAGLLYILYQFLMATVRNYAKRGVLNNRNLLSSSLWRPEFQNYVVIRLCFLQKLWERFLSFNLPASSDGKHSFTYGYIIFFPPCLFQHSLCSLIWRNMSVLWVQIGNPG